MPILFESRLTRVPKGAAARFAAAAVALPALGLVARYEYLWRKAQGLIALAESFPRDYHAGYVGDPPATYLVMGDSTSVGTGAGSLEATFPYGCACTFARRGYWVRVINVAKVGARIADVVSEQVPEVEAWRPDFVTVSIGANDAVRFTDLDAFASDLRTLVSVLKPCPHVYFGSTPDVEMLPALTRFFAARVGVRARQQNRFLDDLAPEAGVRIVDLYGHGRLDPRFNPGFYATDAYHPTDAGYRVWRGLFEKAIKQEAAVWIGG
jgi:lysophospholipase L1-like esterase